MLGRLDLRRAGLLLTHIYVLGFTGVLFGGFGVQFGESEMPCPLCVLQRMAMMLCALGPIYIIQRTRHGNVTTTEYATGWGLAIVAAVAGGSMSTRQVLLHIKPEDPGYGSEVLGFHLYTWALITFVVAVVAAALMLVLAEELAPQDRTFPGLSTVTLGLFGLVVAANLGVVFVEEGFHWVLPDDPARYELLYQLGIK